MIRVFDMLSNCFNKDKKINNKGTQFVGKREWWNRGMVESAAFNVESFYSSPIMAKICRKQ